MRTNITKTASSCFFLLRRLCRLRRCADQAMLQQLVSALILSRIDYCTAVLADRPQSTIASLQQVMNAAVRFVAGHGQRDHVTESIKALHWLPVQYRIKLKPRVMMHSVANCTSPVYTSPVWSCLHHISGYTNKRNSSCGWKIRPSEV